MKWLTLWIAALTGLLLEGQAADGDTNILALHLGLQAIRESGAWRDYVAGNVRPADIKIEAEPFLTGGEILSYNKTNHQFSVSADTARRIAKAVKGIPRRLEDGSGWYFFENADYPFVCFVSGEPLFVGWFQPRFLRSSIPYLLCIRMDRPIVFPSTKQTLSHLS